MKLLHKTLQHYLTFSVVIFVVSIPMFYFIVQKLWIEDVDDSLVYQKEKIIAGILSSGLDSTNISGFTETAQKYDLGISITLVENSVPEKDSIYYNSFYDETRSHVEPFRELKSVVKIDGKSYKMFIRKDLVESADLIRGIALIQALLFFLLLIGIFLLNQYFAKKTWRPFYRLVERLNTFRIDKEEPIHAEKSNISEFNELNQSVAKLTENNIRVFRAQKEFTENAAHETQTPLAAIKTQLDLMAQEPGLTQKQSEFIERMDKNLRHLSQLNRNLLLLAKIDNDQFDVTEPVNLSLTLKETTGIFEEQWKLKEINVQVKIQNAPVIISNAYLMQLLFSNLVKNAVKYNIPGGFIEIELIGNIFRITNSGQKKPLPADDIFRRFYKKGEQESSSGLGLAIAKRICELLKFEISYNFQEPGNHSFVVNFRKNN
jgi:signal transduction histidine kinase